MTSRTMMNNLPRRGVGLGLAGLALIWPALAAMSAAQARQILKETGVTGGLVVHVGCGDGKLTAALRASEAFVVRGFGC